MYVRTYVYVCMYVCMYVWGNPLILDRHLRPLYYPSMARAGFFTVRDLNVLPPPQRYTVSALVYLRVLEAVPQCWNQLPREPEWETFRWMSELCLFKHSHEPIPLREATTRIIYHRLRDNIRSTPNCYDAWRQHHSASSLTDSSWKLLWMRSQPFSARLPLEIDAQGTANARQTSPVPFDCI